MTYDLTEVQAPRASGTMLKVLVSLVEGSITGRLLSHKLLSDSGILDMRDAESESVHPVQPPYLPRTGASDPIMHGPVLDIAPLQHESPARTPGFSFETAADFVRAYQSGQLSPSDVAERVLENTTWSESLAPKMRFFIAQNADDVRKQAEASTRRWQRGEPAGMLDGVPVAVKDELDQSGYPTTVGTRFLGNTPSNRDATVVGRLREQGAILIGKTNMHEIGMGVTGINPHHGACRNPYDPARSPGGSSSGPAATVAAGLCPIAVGADGGGSIRIPASFNGVVGLKCTFGRVSEHGAAPLCWSVAHVGPIAATVQDTALAYAIMAGPDARDPNSQNQPNVHLEGLYRDDLQNVRIGIFGPWFEHAEPDVVASCKAALEPLLAAGATLVPIEIPELRLLQAVHLVTIVSEMAAAHQQYYAKNRKAYGHDVRGNLALARQLSARDYVHAQRLRQRLCAHFAGAFQTVDMIATPTTGCTAPLIPDSALRTGLSDLELTARIMRYAQPGNLTGLPAISVPAGYDKAGLPVGLQLMGPPWSEDQLLRYARVVERGVERKQPTVFRRLLGS